VRCSNSMKKVSLLQLKEKRDRVLMPVAIKRHFFWQDFVESRQPVCEGDLQVVNPT
jgi:hypothetical protein